MFRTITNLEKTYVQSLFREKVTVKEDVQEIYDSAGRVRYHKTYYTVVPSGALKTYTDYWSTRLYVLPRPIEVIVIERETDTKTMVVCKYGRAIPMSSRAVDNISVIIRIANHYLKEEVMNIPNFFLN